jgi:hypothetical protein
MCFQTDCVWRINWLLFFESSNWFFLSKSWNSESSGVDPRNPKMFTKMSNNKETIKKLSGKVTLAVRFVSPNKITNEIPSIEFDKCRRRYVNFFLFYIWIHCLSKWHRRNGANCSVYMQFLYKVCIWIRILKKKRNPELSFRRKVSENGAIKKLKPLLNQRIQFCEIVLSLIDFFFVGKRWNGLKLTQVERAAHRSLVCLFNSSTVNHLNPTKNI